METKPKPHLYIMRCVLAITCLFISLAATAQCPTPRPGDTARAGNIFWVPGYEKLYVSTDSGGHWHSEPTTKGVLAMRLQANGDSTVLLWDNTADTYLYSLATHKLEPYVPTRPLAGFLAAPIVSVSVSCHYEDTNGSRAATIAYTTTDEGAVPQAKDYTIEHYYMKAGRHDQLKTITSAWKRKLDMPGLLALLQAINNDPESVPAIKDFHITERDKRNHPAIADKADTISTKLLRQMLNANSNNGNNYDYTIEVEITNSKNEKLIFHRRYDDEHQPWLVPFMAYTPQWGCNGFKTFSLEFAKFLTASLPKDFLVNDVCNNDALLGWMERSL